MNKLKQFKAHAIIFDKDGTLIDFDAMWSGWAIYLAEQLTQVSGLKVREALCLAMGYDDVDKKVLAHGKLATTSMPQLYRLTVEVMQSLGLNETSAEQVVEKAWCIPDPVLLAKPLIDIRALFENLRAEGKKIAIATADDRKPTQAMIDAFDIEEYISSMVCGDDGVAVKPAPDMVLEICKQIHVDPSKTMVIGDTIADLKMARSAGAGLVVGVLSGVSSAKDLAPFADVLIESVDELYFYSIRQANAFDNLSKGLNPNIIF